MAFLTILEKGFPAILSIATLGWLLYREVTSGSSRLRKAIDEDNKIRRDQLEEKVKLLQDEFNERETKCATDIKQLGEGIARLEATNLEKDKNNETLRAILQGRNPEMVELLTEIKNSHSTILDYMKLMLEQITPELLYQTKLLEFSPLVKKTAKRVIPKKNKTIKK